MEGRILSDATNQPTQPLRLKSELKDASCSTPRAPLTTPRTPRVSSVMVGPTPTHSHSPYRHVQKLEAMIKVLTAKIEKERQHRHKVKKHLEENDVHKRQLLEELKKKHGEFLGVTAEANKLHHTVLELRTKVEESKKERTKAQRRLEQECDRLRREIAARDEEKLSMRQTLEELETKYVNTKMEIGRVQDTIVMISQEDKARIQATERQALVYGKLKIARERKNQALSTPGKTAADEKRAYRLLLQEYKDATAEMHKAESKIALLEQQADDLVNELKAKERQLEHMSSITRRLEDEITDAKLKEEQYSKQVQELADEKQSLNSSYAQACQQVEELSQQLNLKTQQLQSVEGEKAELQVSKEKELKELSACKAAAEQRVTELEHRLRENEEQLNEARVNVTRGTPRGEGAKIVVRKSFEKIKALQLELEEVHAKRQNAELALVKMNGEVQDVRRTAHMLKQLTAERDALNTTLKRLELDHSAELQALAEAKDEQAAAQAQQMTETISSYMQHVANLAAENEALKAERDSAVEEYHKLGAENLELLENLELSEDDLVDARYQLGNTQELAVMKKEHDELLADKAVLSSKVNELMNYQQYLLDELSEKEEQLLNASSGAQAADELMAEVSNLTQQLRTKQTEVGALEAELSTAQQHSEQLRQELVEAKAQGTPRGEGAKEVVKLSFSKIKDLNSELDAIKIHDAMSADRISHLEEQLDDLHMKLAVAEDRASHQQLEMVELKQQHKEAHQQNVAAVNAARSESDAHLAKAESLSVQLEQLKQDLEQSSDACQRKDADMEELRQQLDETTAALQQAKQLAEAKACEQNDHVAKLQAKVEEQLGQLKSANEEVSTLRQQLAYAEADCLKLGGELQLQEQQFEQGQHGLQDEVALLKCNLDDMTHKCEALQKHNDSLLLDVEAATKRAEQLQAEVDQARRLGPPRGEGAKAVMKKSFAKIHFLQGELCNAKQQLELLKSASARIGEMEEVITGLELELENKKNKVTELQQQLEGQEQQHNQEAAQMVAQIQELQEQIAELIREKDEIVRQANEKEAEMLDEFDSLHQEVQRLKQGFDQETNNSLAQLNDLHEQLQSELSTVTDEKQKLLREKTQLTKEVQNLMEVMGLLEGHSETTTRQVVELKETLQQVEKERNDAVQAKTLAEGQFDELQREYQNLDSRQECVQTTLEAMQERVASSHSEIQQAVARVQHLQQEVDMLESDKTELQRSYEDALQTIERLSKQLKVKEQMSVLPEAAASDTSTAADLMHPVAEGSGVQNQAAGCVLQGTGTPQATALQERVTSHSEIEPATPLHGIHNTDMVDRLSSAWHFAMVGSKASQTMAPLPPHLLLDDSKATTRPLLGRRGTRKGKHQAAYIATAGAICAAVAVGRALMHKGR